MCVITNPTTEAMAGLQESLHTHCLLCGKNHPVGYHLSFDMAENDGVQAVFDCEALYQGYTGYLHGGVISAILDAAMTNCLFAHGKEAVTGLLNIRFIVPVQIGERAVVKAWVDRSDIPLHYMRSTLEQNGRVVSRATATFMEINVRELKPVGVPL